MPKNAEHCYVFLLEETPHRLPTKVLEKRRKKHAKLRYLSLNRLHQRIVEYLQTSPPPGSIFGTVQLRLLNEASLAITKEW